MYISLYATAKVINELYKKEGISREITPQYLYNYARNNKLPVDVVDKKVLVEDIQKLYNWTKSTSRSSKVDIESIANSIL